MAGRTPAEAVGAFLGPLQQALDCLTPTVLNVSGGYYVEFEGPRGPWKVQTTAYFYELRRGEHELIAYHWHPQGASSYTTPHLHIGPGAELGFAALRRAHLPTGRIAVEEVLRTAVLAGRLSPSRSPSPR